MDQRIFIAQLNIENYRRRLDGETDAAQRRMIGTLLLEEEAKVASLRGAIAELALSVLLSILAERAVALVPDFVRDGGRPDVAALTVIFKEIPCNVSLLDGAGNVLVANTDARHMPGEEVPSPDQHNVTAWHVYGHDGRLLTPDSWPAARALRGEHVNPGLVAVHRGEGGTERSLRVAAVPVATPDGWVLGAIEAVYEPLVLEQPGTGEQLERMCLVAKVPWRRLGP